jgi:peptide/nickel transport system substrate-binding protein
MKHLTALILAGSTALFASAAMAQQAHIRVGMQLEPPNLDPTSARRRPRLTRWSIPTCSRV